MYNLRRPRCIYPWIRTGLLLILFFGALFHPDPVVAGPASVTQSIRWLRPGPEVADGSYLINYTNLSLQTDRWSLRGGVSWLNWNSESPLVTPSDESGFGAFYLTAGHKIWGSHRSRHNMRSTIWLRVRTKLPMKSDPSTLGSGKMDWGASLFTSTHWNRLMVFTEFSYLDLGDPVNYTYRSLASASFSISYRPRQFPLYPLASVLISSSSQTGDPAYAEVSGGVGMPMSRHTSLSAFYSYGLTRVSPDASIAVLLSWRP